MKSKIGLVKSSQTTCGNCYYLENNLSKFGDIKPCKERRITVKEGFQKADSPVCEFFKEISINFHSNIAPSSEEMYSHIIEGEFQSSRDALVVGKAYEDFIQEHGLNIPFSSNDFLGLVSKISGLRTINQLCNVMGMAQYAPQIVIAEIAKMYKLPITAFPPIVLSPLESVPGSLKKKKVVNDTVGAEDSITKKKKKKKKKLIEEESSDTVDRVIKKKKKKKKKLQS